MKTASRWHSERIGQDITLVRWGHWGQPVLVFPTAGGDAEEIERMQLIAALWGLIVWREFKSAPPGTSKYLALMLAGYTIGLVLIGAATL